MSRLLGLLVLGLGICLTAHSAQLKFDQLIDTVGVAMDEQTTEGEVMAIDLAQRSIVIAGYRYYLPGINDPTPLVVKLLGGRTGSLQLLSPGQQMKIYYIQVGDNRLAYELLQIGSVAEH